MNRYLVLGIFLISIVAISGCRSRTKPSSIATPAPTRLPVESISGNWILEKLNGHLVESEGYEDEKPRLEIHEENKTYFGYTGCNHMNGEFVFNETTIQFKPGPMTRKACIDKGNIETDFLKALSAVTMYTIRNGVLDLKTGDNTVVCSFKRQ